MSQPALSRPLWRDAGFLRFWGGQTFSAFGEQFGQLAIPIVAVTILHATEFEVGLLNAVETLAFLVIGLPAGAWIDRMIKRRVMLTVDLGRAILLGLLPILWFVGALQFWQLIVIGTAVGVGSVFFDVSYQSFIPKLAPSDRIADANGKLETTMQVARIAGPAVGGGLLAIVAAPVLLLVTAATYLLSFGAIASLQDRETKAARETRRSLVVEIREGMAWVIHQPLLVRIVASVSIGNLFGTILMTMLPVLALRTLGIPPSIYGVIFAIGGIGGVLGGVLTSALSRILGEGRVIPVAAVVLGIALLITASAGVFTSISIVLLIVGDFVFGFAVLVFNITSVSYRQRICPPELLGRMNASVRFVVWGVIPIGSICSGLLAGAIGLVPALFVGAVGALLSAGPVVFSPLRRLRVLVPPEADMTGTRTPGSASDADVQTATDTDRQPQPEAGPASGPERPME